MREITTHKVNGCNEAIKIEVFDEPGPGGACHHYHFSLLNGDGTAEEGDTILFQNGPIAEVGVNGITNEALLAIVADRLASFQKGPYACPENAFALASVMEAMDALHNRTKNRVARNVEGTMKV